MKKCKRLILRITEEPDENKLHPSIRHCSQMISCLQGGGGWGRPKGLSYDKGGGGVGRKVIFYDGKVEERCFS